MTSPCRLQNIRQPPKHKQNRCSYSDHYIVRGRMQMLKPTTGVLAQPTRRKYCLRSAHLSQSARVPPSPLSTTLFFASESGRQAAMETVGAKVAPAVAPCNQSGLSSPTSQGATAPTCATHHLDSQISLREGKVPLEGGHDEEAGRVLGRSPLLTLPFPPFETTPCPPCVLAQATNY